MKALSKISALCSLQILLTLPAFADCQWDDYQALKVRFDRFVSARIPQECKSMTQFMHEEAYAVDQNTIKYEMFISSDETCFTKIAKSVQESLKNGEKPQCGPDYASDVTVYGGQDMYLVFSFKVTEARAREAGWQSPEPDNIPRCDFVETITIPAKEGRHMLPVAHAYKLSDGSIVLLGQLTVDADGSPHAYHPHSDKGLDDLDNAGHPGNWVGIATDNCAPDGNPIIQGENDPAPGFYVTPTTMRASTLTPCNKQTNYVDAEKIPFVALSPRIAKIQSIKSDHTTKGNAVVVQNPFGLEKYAIHADQAPGYGRGEASVKLASELGYNPNARVGGTEKREVVYLILPERLGFPKDAASIDKDVEPLFQAWGGEKRLAACRAAVEKAAR